jgi:photosystem II stability/assembly factor-like uncharacterized protein
MIDESTGWCVGDIGTILKTTDGNTWENNYTDFSDDLYDIFFINQQTGWITGENGLILKTVDGGENWLSQESNTTETLKNVVFCDEDTGWATGSSIILHTTDGGETWLEQNTISSGNIIKIALADAQKAWLITYSPAKIYYTSDGGNTWTEYNGNFDTGYNDIYFTSENNGWIVGGGALILNTDNCGGIVGVNDFENNKSISTISNFPNPFKKNTTISYNVSIPAIVRVTVYNSLGEKITTLANNFQLPGNYSVVWDGTGLPAGIYYCKVDNEINTFMVKMLLVE